jgi:hypothetical protein
MTDHEGSSEPDEAPVSGAARLFDLRILIAGLFLVYGVILIVVGIFDTASEVQKADGIRINVWTGIGMALLGAVFALWVKLRPLTPTPSPADPDSGARTEHDGEAARDGDVTG